MARRSPSSTDPPPATLAISSHRSSRREQEVMSLARTEPRLPEQPGTLSLAAQHSTDAGHLAQPHPASRPRRRTLAADKGAMAAASGSARSTLLAAVALQDHLARTIGFPGGPTKQPSTQPGAPMTLAQHLGLIPRPPPLLSKADWDEVHLTARLRQHSVSECPICQEAFGPSPQVLLSCAHVFHQACLASFERFARTRCCPLCRASQYQKRLIQDGARAHREQCATRIQAAVRGWLARRRVRALRRTHPPTDARLRRAWAADRLGEESARVVAELDAARGDVDALFAELDAGLALSRAAAAELEGAAERRRMMSEGTTVVPAPVEQRHTQALPPPQGQRPETDDANVPAPSATTIDWDVVVARARARGATECPICIGHLTRKRGAGVAWLSCTHCFHVECITAFEAFELSAGGTPSCPVCRATYERRCFA